MKKYVPFVSFWLLNSILVNAATVVAPANVVLGNFWLSKGAATLWTGFWVTLVVWLAAPAGRRLGLKLKGRNAMFAFYWLANAAAIWLAARFAFFTGFGISRFTWAIGLGLILNAFQWALWQGLKRYKLASK